MPIRSLPNGTIEYMSEITHASKLRFSLWQRIKILFGRPVYYQATVYLADENFSIVGSERYVYVEQFFPGPPEAEMEVEGGEYGISYPDDYKHLS